MSVFSRKTTAPSTPPVLDSSEGETEPHRDPTEEGGQPHVAGERGLPPLKPFRSVQSRVSGLLTASLMIALAAGLLTYYYTHALGRRTEERSQAQSRQNKRAQGESILPPLSSFHMPAPPNRSAPEVSTASTSRPDSTLDRVLGDAPPLPATLPGTPLPGGNPYAGIGTPPAPAPKSPAQLAMERRLGGPTLVRTSTQEPSVSNVLNYSGSATPVATASGVSSPVTLPQSNAVGHDDSAGRLGLSLDSYLHPTPIAATAARVIPTQRLLLPKGAFIDCTLETAILSALPGMTTCVTATDTFSADGTVVLMERGTKLIGETEGQVQAGTPRLFVIWTEARTPAGIVIPLESPGTDELGRSGLPGIVDWHWWQRFGSALLVSVISGAIQGVSDRGNTTVQVNPSGASDVISQILQHSANIPPTLSKNQGDRIEIFVARDVDFESVYSLQVRAGGLH